MLNATQRIAWIGTVLCLLLTLSPLAQAGPPLICRTFDAGTAQLLQWDANHRKRPPWNAPDRNYDVDRLGADLLTLLSPDAPVLARMENMRRAAIYAMGDDSAAAELLAAVLARALDSAASGAPDPLAYFDAGYLVESYRQASWMHGKAERKDVRGLDGYAWVRKALELSGSNAEMEFAASLMRREGAQADEHLRRAVAGAAPGSLLARNLGSR